MIKSTRVFREFEKAFNHFFDECERGFTNELIISMYCRLNTPGKTVISYKSNVKEMYFIRQGVVEVFNPDHDNSKKDITGADQNARQDRLQYEEQAILYLPKFSYFGDYQILFNLKSNIIFKTLAQYPDQSKKQNLEQLPDIIFMCVGRPKLDELCQLFPQTAENIKRKALERRLRFMQQKNLKSARFVRKRDEYRDQHGTDGTTYEEGLKDFHSDEEPESIQSQKEDMKMYLSKLNSRIDNLVEALKKAEQSIARQIIGKKTTDGQVMAIANNAENKSIADNFLQDI